MKCMIHGTVQGYNTWSIQHNTSSAPRQLFENCLKDNFQLIYKICLRFQYNVICKVALHAKLCQKPVMYLKNPI